MSPHSHFLTAAMFSDYLDQLRALVHAAVPPGWAWLDGVLTSLVDFFEVSVVAPGGRYYWITGIESMVVLAVVYVAWGGLGSSGFRGFWRFCFPKGTYTHPSTRVDYQINLANYFVSPLVNLVWRFNATFFTGQLLALLIWTFGPAPHLLHWNAATLVGFTIVFAIADDFGYWVWHYLAHKVPVLWAFHKVHHSAEVMTPFVAGRVHPLETALLPMFRSAASSVVAAVAIYAFVGQATFVTVFGMTLVAALMAAAGSQLFHAHVPLSWGDRLNRLIISPATHQIHHSVAREHWDKNMGAFFAVWDWMFGTLCLPQPGQKLTYGIAEGAPQIHTNIVSAYLRPLWDAALASRSLLDRLLPSRWRLRLLDHPVAGNGPADAVVVDPVAGPSATFSH
jgi:sterol desaturase/sphingolipid hydroxylase (fatty acid hydroxylase superfamily)